MDERRLRNLFQFTEADLEANRRGQFSENQKKRLRDKARAEQKSAWESATILFVVAAMGLAFGLIVASVAPIPLGRILFVALLCILWPFAWVGKGIQIIRSARTLQEPRLRTVSGRADIIKYDSETYVLKVGELEFDLDGNPSGVIVEGDEYAIHYVEVTEEILSVGF